jgi:hypothetical protein
VRRDDANARVDFAPQVAKLAAQAGAVSVAIAELPKDWPRKWDLGDPPPDGVDAELLHRLLTAAPPWQPRLDDAGRIAN